MYFFGSPGGGGGGGGGVLWVLKHPLQPRQHTGFNQITNVVVYNKVFCSISVHDARDCVSLAGHQGST